MTSSPSSSTAPDDASLFARYSDEERERLTEILDRYLEALESGAPLAQEELLAAHPDLADALRAYFRSLEDLHSMAAGFAGAAHAAQSPPRREGVKAIGDFELLREIGRGGMGVVYEARQISLDRRVAVKLLPFAAVLDARQIARFKHEAQAAAQIHHPNIVPVFAIGVERGVHYYAMQYIDGQPLDRAIEELRAARNRRRPRHRGWTTGMGSLFRVANTPAQSAASAGRSLGEGRSPATTVWLAGGQNGPTAELPETRDERQSATHASCLVTQAANHAEHYRAAIRIGIQAAEALHAAHEFGVVHRDVKPSNLLLEASGKLWVTDFGLARFQRDASLTRTGDLIGTMRYMSPEQAAGQSALVDHRTDIYSLGVTLYELVCLRPAFPEDRGPALLKQIDSYDPPRPRQVQPDIPADLETVILKAMARERDERYRTAHELADDLRCVLEGKATQARPPSLIDRMSRWARRQRRAVFAGAIAMSLAIIGLAISTGLVTRATIRANSALAQADLDFRQASDALDQFGLKTVENLADIPGAEAERERLLRDACDYYRRFVEQKRSNPQQRLDVAIAYGKLGALLEQRAAWRDALAAHQKAVELLDQLAAERRGDPAIERQLALAENNVGLALRRTGKTDAGREAVAGAVRRQERLLARSPRDADVRAELGASLCNLGQLQQEVGDLAAARASFAAAIENLQRAREGRPTDDADQRHTDHQKLAAAYNNLAGILLASDPGEAARLHTQALELLKTAAAARPKDLSLRRELALTLHNLAATCSHEQQYAAARSIYEQAVAARQQLVLLAPARLTFQADLALSLNNLGLAEFRLGEHAAALATFRRAIEVYEAVGRQTPEDLSPQSHLGSVYNNLGIVLEKSGELAAAAEAFEQAIAVQGAVFAKSPEFPGCRQSLSKHYENLGRVCRGLEQPDKALESALARRRLQAGNGPELYRVAQEMAAIAALVAQSPASALSHEQCTKLVSETFAEARAAGYPPASTSDYDKTLAGSERTTSLVPLSRPLP